MYSKKKKGIIGIIITIVILIFIVIISNIEINNLSYAQNALNFFVMPIQNGLTYFKNWLFRNNDFFEDISKLKEENEKLKEDNSNLQKSLREYEIIKSENETLKEYMDLKSKYGEYETIPAYVINKDISNYSNVIVINVGTNDGVNINMPVISDKGLVGHIISATPTNAKVQTIIDTASNVSCTLTSTRDTLVAKGTLEGNSKLKATYIEPEATLIQGGTLETSGLGGIYPKGILVGTINKVISTKNITDRYALIDTAVNFSKLETVLVITK